MSQYPALPRGSYNSGWNDPPKFESNPITSAAPLNKPKLNLNKRIAFPMTQSISARNTGALGISLAAANVETKQGTGEHVHSILSSSSPLLNLPPPPLIPELSTSPLRLCSYDQQTKETDEFHCGDCIITDAPDALEFVRKIFNATLTGCQDDANKTDVIQKRIDVMEKMWKQNKLKDSIKSKLIQIAKALEQNEPTKANDLHRTLVIDNASTSFQWGSALRQIILIKEQSIPVSKSKSSAVTGMAAHAIYRGYLIPSFKISDHTMRDDGVGESKKSPGRIQHL